MNALKTVVSRDGKLKGKPTGGEHECRQVGGCRGTQIAVRWEDGRLSWPCTAGMAYSPKGQRARLT